MNMVICIATIYNEKNEMKNIWDLFSESKGQPIAYGGRVLVRADKLLIGKQPRILRYKIISTDSDWRQGISFRTNGIIRYHGNEIKKGWADIWENEMPREDIVECKSKDGVLWVKNIWDEGRGGTESWNNGAAMWLEEIPNGRRYYCNDGHFDDDMNNIIFELTIGS